MLFDGYSHRIKKKIKDILFASKFISGTNCKRIEIFYHDPDQRVTCKDGHCSFPELSQDEPSLGIEFRGYRKITNVYITEKMLLACRWDSSSSVYNLNVGWLRCQD